MKVFLLSASVLGALTSTIVAAEPQKAWEASGFKNPESVVYDHAAEAIYVSNVDGEPMGKDGNGFVSKLGPNGQVVALEWIKKLNAPKGLALAGGKLYVADIDELVAIDVAQGAITARYDVPDAKFLNDVTADAQGRVYVSDMVTNSIWALDGGKLSLWLHDDALDHPNGLLAEDEQIVVASWGTMDENAPTKVPGRMRVVDLGTKKVSDLGDSTLAGNLDGVVPDGKGGYFVTDWVNGGLFHILAEGKATRLLPLKQGSADLGTGPAGSLVVVPMMMDGTVLAYRVD